MLHLFICSFSFIKHPVLFKIWFTDQYKEFAKNVNQLSHGAHYLFNFFFHRKTFFSMNGAISMVDILEQVAYLMLYQ